MYLDNRGCTFFMRPLNTYEKSNIFVDAPGSGKELMISIRELF